MAADKMIEICWIQHGGEQGWLNVLIQKMADRNITTRMVTILREAQDFYVANGVQSDFISPFAFDEGVTVTDEEIEELDRRYGMPNVRSIAEGDVTLLRVVGRDIRRRMAVVARAYKYWEDYLDRHNISVFCGRESATFATRTAMNIGKSRGIPFWRGDIGPDDNHFTMTEIDEEACWQELVDELAKGFKPVSDERERQLVALVEDRVSKRSGPMSMRPGGVALHQLPRTMARILRDARRVDRRMDPVKVCEYRTRLRFTWERSLFKAFHRRFPYEQPVDGEKYVYFPLYFADELMTRARYQFWSRNLVELVRAAATALPAGYVLYIKEHPGVPGDLWPLEIWRLKQIPNTKVIDPTYQSRELLRKAQAVVVIQGTAGWEAFLLQRPVVVVNANLYYARSDLTFKVGDITQLGAALYAALQQGPELYQRRRDEWLWFLDCVWRSAYMGCFTKYEHPYFFGSNLDNAEKMADGISAKVARYIPEKSEGPR